MQHFKVFISSTFEDLSEQRKVAIDVTIGLQWLPVCMEYLPAADIHPWDFIEQQIVVSDFYVIIVGGRYGSVDDEGLSFTERELNCALKNDIPILAFLHSDPGKIELSRSDTTPELHSKLQRMRSRLKEGRYVAHWNSTESLRAELLKSFAFAPRCHVRPGLVRGTSAVETKKSLKPYSVTPAVRSTFRKYRIVLDYRMLRRDLTMIPNLKAHLKPGESEIRLVLPLADRGRELEFVLPGRFEVSPQDTNRLAAMPGVAEVLEM